ncbi:MAG: hypothetical protein JWO46_2200, partial [Nocardioidaceae bacterium]|nr:hypothetical protein [Nocardioidaceae bacterium]
SEVAPADGSLAVHVQVSRGLVTAAIEDSAVDVLDPKATPVSEWIPDQTQPARRVVLVGLPPPAAQKAAVGDPTLPKELSDGAGLVIANPSDEAVIANVRLSTKDGASAPAGLGPTTIGPQSAVTVPLADLVKDPVTSVIVDADHPVTAGYVVPGRTDLVHAAPGQHWQGPAAAALPPGTQRTLVLTADDGAGSVTVSQRGPQGKELDASTVTVPDRSTVSTALLPNAASVVVTSGGKVVGTVLVVTGTSYTSLPLAPVLGPLRVPEVRPGS